MSDIFLEIELGKDRYQAGETLSGILKVWPRTPARVLRLFGSFVGTESYGKPKSLKQLHICDCEVPVTGGPGNTPRGDIVESEARFHFSFVIPADLPTSVTVIEEGEKEEPVTVAIT